MNTKICLIAACLLGTTFFSCKRDAVDPQQPNKPSHKEDPVVPPTPKPTREVSGDPATPFSVTAKLNGLTFDNSDRLAPRPDYRPLGRLRALLNNLILKGRIPLGETLITTQQLEEIKQEADKIVEQAKAKTQREKHDALLKWVKTNVKYDHGGGKVGQLDLTTLVGNPNANTAYTTFSEKKAVCQGYANLLKVMCYTQGINAPVVNGFVYWNGLIGGHAWNYVHVDGQWIISDPTNSPTTRFNLSDTSREALEFQPTRIDFTIVNNENFECMYTDGEVTISKIKKGEGGKTAVHIPESLGGFVISTFLPKEIADGITEIHLGSKVRDFGKEGGRQFASDRPDTGVDRNIARVYVPENNPYIEDYQGVLYSKVRNKTDQILFIPKRLEVVKLKPGRFDKESKLRHLSGVKKIYFHENTTEIGPSAIQNCASLEEVYIPKDLKIEEDILKRICNNCPKNPRIIRY